MLYFLLNTSSLCGTVAAYTAAYALLLPVQMLWISRKAGSLLTCRISPRVLRNLFSVTGVLAVYTCFQTLLFNLDSLMLTLIAGPRMTAVYNIALPVTQLLLSVLVFAQVFLPIAADMVRAGDSARLKKYIFGALLITLAVLPCLFAAAAWCGKFLISLLFKGSYADSAAPVLPWLMCGYLLFAFGSFIAQTLIAMRRIGLLLIVSGVTVVLDFSLMYLFIRSAGAVGAAMATCASYAFFAIAAFAVFLRGTRQSNDLPGEFSGEQGKEVPSVADRGNLQEGDR